MINGQVRLIDLAWLSTCGCTGWARNCDEIVRVIDFLISLNRAKISNSIFSKELHWC